MPTKAETEVFQLEKDYSEAIKKGDGRALEKLTSSPCVVVGGQGVVQFNSDQIADMTRSSDFKLKSYKMDEKSASFRELRPGVAALAYKVHEEYDRAGKPWATDSYNSSVWVKNGNTWECALHTESLVAPPN